MIDPVFAAMADTLHKYALAIDPVCDQVRLAWIYPCAMPKFGPFPRGAWKLGQKFECEDQTIAIGHGLINAMGFDGVAGNGGKVPFRSL